MLYGQYLGINGSLFELKVLGLQLMTIALQASMQNFKGLALRRFAITLRVRIRSVETTNDLLLILYYEKLKVLCFVRNT